jgi:hypothetical protein
MADTEAPHADEDYVFISALNQYSYCPLRCYWMFVEHEYADNEHTIEGSLGHTRVHTEGQTSRGELFQLRSAYLYSRRYGICGRADLIEEHDGTVYPVEYKKGRLGNWTNDALQLCAQALCLEEGSAERGAGRSRPHSPGVYLLCQHWTTQSGATHTGIACPDARDGRCRTRPPAHAPAP